jgi:hypothetical protein
MMQQATHDKTMIDWLESKINGNDSMTKNMRIVEDVDNLSRAPIGLMRDI